MRAVEQDGVDLILCRPGEPVDVSVPGREASPQPCHHAIMDTPFVLRGRYRHVATGFDVGRAGLDGLKHLVFFDPGFIDQTPDCLFQKRR